MGDRQRWQNLPTKSRCAGYTCCRLRRWNSKSPWTFSAMRSAKAPLGPHRCCFLTLNDRRVCHRWCRKRRRVCRSTTSGPKAETRILLKSVSCWSLLGAVGKQANHYFWERPENLTVIIHWYWKWYNVIYFYYRPYTGSIYIINIILVYIIGYNSPRKS